jgi:hypothetical protein
MRVIKSLCGARGNVTLHVHLYIFTLIDLYLKNNYFNYNLKLSK